MKKQKGMSLIGLILGGGALVILAIVGMKVAPSVIEYFTALKHVKAIAASGEARGSVADIRKAYDMRAVVDETPDLTGADLEVSKAGGDLVISFAYSKKIPLVANVSLCIDFAGSTSPGKRTAVD